MTTEPVTLNPANDDGWVPQACTLPSAEQPLRVAEFDGLFATGLLGLERTAPTVLRLSLAAASEVVARKLTARESSCCSFFGFTFTRGSEGRVLLEVAVPAAHIEVLNALAERAAAAAGLTPAAPA